MSARKPSQSGTTVNRIAELEAKIAQLQTLLESMPTNQVTQPVPGEKLNSDDYVEVVSLCPWQLTLTTQSRGQGKAFKFKQFGEHKRILYGDITNILEVNSSFFERGYFLILDERVIQRHGLHEVYSKILKEEMLEKIFTCESQDSVKLYQVANDRQRKFADMVIIKKLKENPESLDLNIVSAIERISKIKYSEIADEQRELEKG